MQKCEAQLKAGEPLMQEAVLYARELTQDSSFDDEEKEVISRDMAQLQEHYDELRNFVEDEQEGFVKLFICIYTRCIKFECSYFQNEYYISSSPRLMANTEFNTIIYIKFS